VVEAGWWWVVKTSSKAVLSKWRGTHDVQTEKTRFAIDE